MMFDVPTLIDRSLHSTRISSAVFAITLCVAVQLAGAPSADACTCMSSGPACQAFWTTDVVFDGTVTTIEPTSRQETFSGRTFPVSEFVVTLQVRQGWKGVEGETVQVTTSGSGASCGFDFKMGGRYLVFASRGGSDSRPRVSLCSFTRAYNGSGEPAAFFVSLGAPETGGRVFGTIQSSTRSFKPPNSSSRSPMDLEVRLTGNGRTLSTTAKAGRYEFSGLAAGNYGLSVLVPDGYFTWMPTRPVEIPNQRACFESDFGLTPSGRISGWVVDKSGRGVSKVDVEVTASDIELDRQDFLEVASTQSDNDGFFELRDLPPGRYIAGINLKDLPSEYRPYARTIFPGGNEPPMPIELALGQNVNLGRWAIPAPLAVVKLTGTITWKDGTPAGGVYVSLSDVGRNAAARARGAGGAMSGPDGRFVIDAREGRVYRFVARLGGTGPALILSAPQIEAHAGLGPIALVIQWDPPR
jgi:hypothetical protein